jgi:hypothetical protein
MDQGDMLSMTEAASLIGVTECRNVVSFGIDRPGLLEALGKLSAL